MDAFIVSHYFLYCYCELYILYFQILLTSLMQIENIMVDVKNET